MTTMPNPSILISNPRTNTRHTFSPHKEVVTGVHCAVKLQCGNNWRGCIGMNIRIKRLVTLIAAMAVVASSQAANTYVNTGVDLGGLGNTVDQRWLIGTSQNYLSSPQASLYSNVAYTASFSGPSAWIGRPDAPANSTTWFTLVFNLDQSFIDSGLALSFKWSSDNESYLYLNNSAAAPGFTDALDSLPYGVLGNYSFHNTKTFVLSTANGLVAGENVLQLAVRNDGATGGFNPTAIRAEFTPVPEPFTMALGAGGIGLALRRRMKKTA